MGIGMNAVKLLERLMAFHACPEEDSGTDALSIIREIMDGEYNTLKQDLWRGMSEPRSALEGPIRVGDKLIWEPQSEARVRVTVTETGILNNELIFGTTDKAGRRCWNSEAQIRAACIRAM